MGRSLAQTGKFFGTLLAASIIVAGGFIYHRWRRIPFATKRIQVLDVPIDPITMNEAIERIDAFIQSGQPHHIFTADASGIMRATNDTQLKQIVKQADIITPDGAGVMLAGRMHGTALPERVSGVDLVARISELAAQKGYTIYLFGSSEGVAQRAADNLRKQFPGLRIVGTRNGFFTPEDETRIVQEIAAAKPDVLFVALGIPKQEIFINTHFTQLGVPVMIGIGGSFDVISGRLHRAPRWMQRVGLEWLYRVQQEPARIPRLAALPRFILANWRTRKQHRDA